MVKVQKGLPKVVTANDLADGLVVFLKTDGTWADSIEMAEIARTDDEIDKILEKGEASALANEVVGPYLIDIEETNGKIKALHIREHMRATGPSVRKDLWK